MHPCHSSILPCTAPLKTRPMFRLCTGCCPSAFRPGRLSPKPRSYRVGELPDITPLRLGGLTGPLGLLAAADASLAAATLGAVAGAVAAAAGPEGGSGRAGVSAQRCGFAKPSQLRRCGRVLTCVRMPTLGTGTAPGPR